MRRSHLPVVFAFFLGIPAWAQQTPAPPLYPAPNSPAQTQSQQELTVDQSGQVPVFRVRVYARSARAVNYRNRGGSTTVDFKGTDLMPAIAGRAKVEGKAGRLAIDVELNHMDPPAKVGKSISDLCLVGSHA